MSNPALDRAAQLVAQRRATGELAMLDGPEHHLVDEALKLAPELDPATIGAAWMMLGDILGRFATELPDAFPGSTLAILAQLAGQRLYTGTDVPREVPCPVVRSNGSPCPFSAKAVTPDLIDAQMRGHYATYHDHLTWAPHEYDGILATLDGEYAPPAGEREACKHCERADPTPFIRYAEGGFACAPCALKRGEATVNQVRQVYGFAPIDDPECDEPLPMSPSARATVAEALAANGASLDDALRYGVATEQEIRERIAGDGGAIVKCERCTDPVVVREGGGTDGVLCPRCVAADGA